MFLLLPTPDAKYGPDGIGIVSLWLLDHWGSMKISIVVVVVTYPIVLALAIMQVRNMSLFCYTLLAPRFIIHLSDLISRSINVITAV